MGYENENNHVPRITQIDSKYLDHEVYLLLRNTFTSAFRFSGQSILVKLEPEFEALLKYLLYHFTLRYEHSSVGQQLLQIKYSENNSSKRLFYCYILAILGAWLKHRVSLFTSDSEQSVLRYLVKIFEVCDISYQVLEVLNLTLFLIGGRYPTLCERIFSLKVTPAVHNGLRKISYGYFTRELLWNGFADLLATTLPLIPAKKFHNFICQFIPNVFSKEDTSLNDDTYVSEIQRVCTVCNELPILPHKFGCKHIACYYCIHSLLVVSSFKCPSCGFLCDNSTHVMPL